MFVLSHDPVARSEPTRRRREGAIASLEKMYHNLYQEHFAYILGDLCEDCQMRRDNTEEGGCIEVCRECIEKKKTIAILRRELVVDQQIRYWIDCYETALSERSEFPHTRLSQS